MLELFKRSFTITLILLFLYVIYFFGNNFLMVITIYLLTLISFYEWIQMQSSSKLKTLLFFVLLLSIYHFNYFNMYYISLLSLSIWILLLLYIFVNPENLRTFLKNNNTLLGFIMFSILFIHLINLYPNNNTLTVSTNLYDNKHYFLIIISLVSAIDIFAYIIGKMFGKTKIVPKISPNKSLEGYIGSYIFSLSFFIIISNMTNILWVPVDLIFFSLFIILAFLGDLFISFAKRTFSVKDSGNILPGHGGLLDRIDSYLPSLPLFYIWFMI
jgi:phosphatidate cytidylyltransferase